MTTEPASQSRLSDSQTAALRHVRDNAVRQRQAASRRIEAVLTNALPDADAGAVAVALAGSVTITAPVVLNFHPDRIASDGRMVAEAMLEDGIYRNQFESGISNGGLTAFPGGDRDRWEERSFGGAYQRPGVSAHERPKYGGLNLMQHPDGPCPRFGSCQLRLRQAVLARTTFSFGDSVTEPRDLGTLDAFDSVLAGLIEAVNSTGAALGRPGMSVTSLVEVLRRALLGIPPVRPGIKAARSTTTSRRRSTAGSSWSPMPRPSSPILPFRAPRSSEHSTRRRGATSSTFVGTPASSSLRPTSRRSFEVQPSRSSRSGSPGSSAAARQGCTPSSSAAPPGRS